MVAGSGIPEMKTIISGDLRKEPERYLCAKTLCTLRYLFRQRALSSLCVVAKAVGLVFAIGGANLSVGREGPFVHASSILSYQLMKHLPFFRKFYLSESMRRHLYSAACAVGVASTFAAPIGGVLFSIEVTSTFFLVSNYWRGFLAAVAGAITKQLLERLLTEKTSFKSFEALFPTNFEPFTTIAVAELLGFVLLGLCMGLLGPLYIRVSSYVRHRAYAILHTYPMSFTAVITALVAALTLLSGPSFNQSVSETLVQLTGSEALPSPWPTSNDPWYRAGSLVLSCLTRLLVAILSVTLPVPAGDFLPFFFSRCRRRTAVWRRNSTVTWDRTGHRRWVCPCGRCGAGGVCHSHGFRRR